jgi:hypothetical protein
MQKRPLDMDNLPLYQELLSTVVQARLKMEKASARADLLLNIFLVSLDVAHLGTEESFVERCINHFELDLLDARDAPELLRDATADMARAMWAYRMKPSTVADQNVRDAFERWENAFQQSFGEAPAEAHMDIENARCQAESDYYPEPPLPFVTRVRLQKVGSQN